MYASSAQPLPLKWPQFLICSQSCLFLLSNNFFFFTKNHKHEGIYSQEVHQYYMRCGRGATQPQSTLGLDIMGCAVHRKENPPRRKRKKKETEERGRDSKGV